MATSYSSSLKLSLMANGEQSGTWGTITNTNWDMIEQAVSGTATITMANSNYTLSNPNGTTGEAHAAVLYVAGTNSAVYQVIAPVAQKVYVVSNQTVGGNAITVGGATGTTVSIPNGVTTLVYCDGTNFYSAVSGVAGAFSVGTNLSVGGVITSTGNITSSGTVAGSSVSGTTISGTTISGTNGTLSSSLGVGTAASGTAGEIRATGNVTAYYTSDNRLKENIVPIPEALDKVNALIGCSFDWTQEFMDNHGGEDGFFVRKHDVGLIAQHVQQVIPEAVAERPDGYLGVQYDKVIPLLVECIKELSAKVEALENRHGA